MKTLFIHIGTPKTGSSAIQKFLEKNRVMLNENGYIFRELPFRDYRKAPSFEVDSEGDLIYKDSSSLFHRRIPARRNGYFLHGWRSEEYREKNKTRLSEGLEIINGWFQEKENVILSDEAIWYSLFLWDFMDRVKEYAKEHGFEVRLMVYLRPQDELLDSILRQRIEAAGLTVSWEEFLSWKKHQENYIGLDYQKKLDYLEKLFGKEKLCVHAYEPAEWAKQNTSIFSILMKDLGLKEGLPVKLPARGVNVSLTHNQAELKRLMNRLTDLNTKEGMEAEELFRNAALDCSALKKDPDGCRYFSGEERAAFCARYEEGNRRIAREYLGREELFPAQGREIVKWNADLENMQEDVILYFGKLSMELYQEILRLKEENRRLKRSSLGYRIHSFFQRRKSRG